MRALVEIANGCVDVDRGKVGQVKTRIQFQESCLVLQQVLIITDHLV